MSRSSQQPNCSAGSKLPPILRLCIVDANKCSMSQIRYNLIACAVALAIETIPIVLLKWRRVRLK